MVSLDKAARFVRDVNVDDLHDQLDSLRDYVNELTASAGTTANRRFKQARRAASSAAHDTEELVKDNVAASLVLAAGLGLVIGYLIRRGSE
jgi:ElaB/YqjD/DUF883 family membrane-anchored ribosome-binding protein